MTRGVNIPEKKFKMTLLDLSGKCWQERICFLRLRSQFSFFFEKKFNLHLLDFEYASPNKNFNTTKLKDVSYSTRCKFSLKFNTQWF